MWEDGTYLTSQSDDVDTSPDARLFNTWTKAIQIAISSELNTWNTWFAGKEYDMVRAYSINSLGACTHSDLLAEQGGLTAQITIVTSNTTWLYLSFTQQPSIYWYFLSSLNNNCHKHLC